MNKNNIPISLGESNIKIINLFFFKKVNDDLFFLIIVFFDGNRDIKNGKKRRSIFGWKVYEIKEEKFVEDRRARLNLFLYILLITIKKTMNEILECCCHVPMLFVCHVPTSKTF